MLYIINSVVYRSNIIRVKSEKSFIYIFFFLLLRESYNENKLLKTLPFKGGKPARLYHPNCQQS